MIRISEKDIEQKSKEILSVQLTNMERAGFGYLSEIVRTAVFSREDYKEKILPIFLRNNPEIIIE